MQTLIPSLWTVTYYPDENAPNVAQPVSVNVYAVNRRFAVWNARDYIGFPSGKVTAKKKK
jgi:hypothetical protein